MTKDPQNDMPAEEPDELWSLIADVRKWLEWQSECGAEDWAVDDWSAWTKHSKNKAFFAVDGRGAHHLEPQFRREQSQIGRCPCHQHSPKFHQAKADIPGAWQHIISVSACPQCLCPVIW